MRALALARLVVFTLFGVWAFPAASLAKPAATPAAEVDGGPFRPRPRPPQGPTPSASPEATSAADLALRERQAKDLQDFRGGAVYLYIGSGATLVLLVVLLLLLI